MHTGPVRQENPAAPALFLRGGLTRLRLAILFAGLSPVIPRPYGVSKGIGDTQSDTPGPPPNATRGFVNPAPDFLHGAGPHVGAIRD
jgi:hypothetical protein